MAPYGRSRRQKVELKILPLRKDAPVYFQKEQKAMIEAAKGDYMLGLDSVEVIERHTLEFNDAFNVTCHFVELTGSLSMKNG